MIGEVIGGYKLARKLGEGGTGETYLAEHQETGGPAAAKILFPTMSADAALLSSFFAEVKAASLVNHVGIADLLDCGVAGNGRAYLLIEYLDGKTLTDSLIELGSVSDGESLADIGWQLATLLSASHAAKIVHGGLKPDGIFLTFPASQAPRPLVKLLDFGMAKFSLGVRHSQTGSLLGAPLYMSPEVSRGLGKVDDRADIYSLGCILFEMACGRPPFVREGKGELIIAHATEIPPSVASLEPSVPQPIATLIDRMLTKNPATRPQTMAEVAAVLEKFFKCPAPGAAQVVQVQPVSVSAPAPPAPVMPATTFPTPPTADVPPGGRLPSRVQPAARRHDPTALLPPSAAATSSVRSPTSSTSPPAQTWVARVHQQTAILAPSASAGHPLASCQPLPARASATSGSQRRRAPTPVARSPRNPRHAAGSSISIPIVVATASVVLAASIGAYFVLRKRSSPVEVSPVSLPAAVTRPQRALADSPFLPPAAPKPEPLPAAPRPPDTRASLPSERRPAREAPLLDPASRPAPGNKRPAGRW